MKLNKAAVDLIMAKKQMTIRDLTITANVSDRTFYNGINGDILPKQVGKIASALGVEPEDIIIPEC